MSMFTCITCRVAFADADVQRSHYKTDWHRYNLKRKVAEMPPVTADNFQQRVMAQREQVQEESKDQSSHCPCCNKHFSTQNAYENHLRSKKHKELLAKEEQRKERQSARQQNKMAEKGLEILPSVDRVSEKNEKNAALKQAEQKVEEPTAAASTSASKVEEPTAAASTSASKDDNDMETDDNESVESWDGDALGLEECFFCSHVSPSLERNVNHMTKHHSFFVPDVEYLVDLEGLVTYLDQKIGEGKICLWCNEKGKSFMTTKSVQQHMIDKGHCKMLFEGDTLCEYADFYDYRKSYPDYVEGEEEMEEDEEDVPVESVEEDNYQLVLPSGATVGHRSLQRYYRQNLRPDRPHQMTPIAKVMAQYKALGWTGTTGHVAKQRAKDISYVQRMKQKHHMRLSVKSHKLVKHYRDAIFSFG